MISTSCWATAASAVVLTHALQPWFLSFTRQRWECVMQSGPTLIYFVTCQLTSAKSVWCQIVLTCERPVENGRRASSCTSSLHPGITFSGRRVLHEREANCRKWKIQTLFKSSFVSDIPTSWEFSKKKKSQMIKYKLYKMKPFTGLVWQFDQDKDHFIYLCSSLSLRTLKNSASSSA